MLCHSFIILGDILRCTRFLLSKELTSPLPHLLLILTDKKGMMLSDELEPRDTAHEIKVMYCQDCVRSIVNVKLYFLCVIEVTLIKLKFLV